MLSFEERQAVLVWVYNVLYAALCALEITKVTCVGPTS
jgi:hypothetical protein